MAFVKNANDILIGTGRMFINGTCVGQLDGDVTVNHSKEFYKVESGFPAQVVKSAKIGEKGELTFALLEANLDTLRSLMPEYVEITETAGTSAYVEETLPIYDNKHTKLGHSVITELESVKTLGTTPATLVEGTDFYFDRLSGTLYRVSTSTAVDAGESVKIKYKHATYAGHGWGAGGGTSTDETYLVEFWHKRTDGKYRCIRMWKCQIEGDFSMEFKEKEHAPVPLTLTMIADSSKPAGQHLFQNIDYEASAAPEGGW